MRKIEEVKLALELYNEHLVLSNNKRLDNDLLKDWERRACQLTIENAQKNLDNIDTCTMIDIAATTNSLIRQIGTAYKLHMDEYYNNFNSFMINRVIGIDENGKLMNGAFWGQAECLQLGIGLEELQVFKGCNPLSYESGDKLRLLVNEHFNTKIPSAKEMRQAEEEYELAIKSGSEEKNEAYIHLVELQERYGIRKNGNIYYYLADDPKYLEATAGRQM